MISSTYQKAIEFAAEAHEGQKRKKSDIPYISHPYAVAAILQQQKCKEHVIIAGVLHDTVEDTDVTIEDLLREFGQVIADIVAGVTEPSKDLSWEQRKTNMVNVIKTAPKEVKFVSCADKLHNLHTVIRTHKKIGDRVWERFSRGYEGQKWYAESMVDSLFFGLDPIHLKPMFFEYKKIVKEFF